jgi:outer membrane protein TolC
MPINSRAFRSNILRRFAALWLLSQVSGGFGAIQPMSLEQALRYALDHSPALDTARRNREIGDLNLAIANTKFLPSVDVSATHGLQKTDPPAVTDPFTSQLNFGITENLYDNGQSLTNYDIAKVNRQIAILQALQVRDQLFLSIVQQYYQYSLALKLAETQKQQFDLLQRKLRSIHGQYREGMSTEKDYLRFKNQVQRSQIDVLTAKLAIDQALLTLKKLVGAPPNAELSFEPVDLPSQAPAVPVDSPPLGHSYEDRIAASQAQLGPLQTRLAVRQYWPQLNLTSALSYANAGYLNSGLPFQSTHTAFLNVQLGLTYNIFDWGQRADAVEVARRNEMIADNNLHATELQVGADVKTLMLTLDEEKANYALTQELLSGEQTSYGVILQDYEEGRSPYLDLITSLSDLLDAKVRVFNAYYGLAQDLAKFHYYDGNLYETIGKPH